MYGMHTRQVGINGEIRMQMRKDVDSLVELLRRIRAIDGVEDPVQLRVVLAHVGRRSFGPLILLAGLVTIAPLIGDIPGVPTLMAILVILTAGQLLVGRQEFWLPEFLLRRSVRRAQLQRVLRWFDRPAALLDRWFSPRLGVVSTGRGAYLIAVACVLVALVVPLLEAIPFSANIAATAWIAFGLAMVFRDGYVALFALLVTFGLFGWLTIEGLQRLT